MSFIPFFSFSCNGRSAFYKVLHPVVAGCNVFKVWVIRFVYVFWWVTTVYLQEKKIQSYKTLQDILHCFLFYWLTKSETDVGTSVEAELSRHWFIFFYFVIDSSWMSVWRKWRLIWKCVWKKMCYWIFPCGKMRPTDIHQMLTEWEQL